MTPPPELLTLAEALDGFNQSLVNIQRAQHGVEIAEDEHKDEARTLLWQACDVLDAAVDEMAKAIKAATGVQRREIRAVRMAGVVAPRVREVKA